MKIRMKIKNRGLNVVWRVLCFLLSTVSVAAQSSKTYHIKATAIGAERTVKVWLPKNYSSKRRYPVLFDIGGADYDAWIAQVAAYYSGAFDRIPPVIVVGVYPGALDEIGFSYETGEVNQAGSRFVRFLLEDVLPCLQRNYHFADFKAIIGHSYLANYTDYFLKHHPDLFQGYVLLAPEQPQYRLDLAALVSHLPQPTYYYLASGKEDVERRQTYAQEIAKQFAAIHREEMHFKYETFSDADHLTTIPRALPAALEYIFSRYKYYTYANTQQKLIPWFDALNSQRERVYGVGIANNSSNAAYFMDLAVEQKDLAALDHFADYFLTPDADVSLWFNAAQYYRSLSAIPKAKALYAKAIVKAKKTNRTDFGILAYRCLSLNIYSEVEQNPAMAWKTLQEGRDALKDIVFNYFLGLIATRHNYNLDEGIQYLLDFERERNESLFGRLYPLDQVEALLAKAYWLKGNTAEASGHVEKALQLNPNNPEAQALKKNLSEKPILK